jgi:hypothetical protein
MLCENGAHERKLTDIQSRPASHGGGEIHYNAECVTCGAPYWQHAIGATVLSHWLMKRGIGDDCDCQSV